MATRVATPITVPRSFAGKVRLNKFSFAPKPISTDATLTVYQGNPQQYASDILGVELTPDQIEIMESVRDNRRTAVKASHAIGKTFTAAILACWWYDCWPSHIVYVTAPTWDQCKGLTFKQIKQFRRLKKLPGTILETGLVRDENKDREPSHFIKALNAETGEGFQGEHSAPILVIFEEATGVPGYIWEAADGLMTHPDCRLLCIGNPTDEATQFGDACLQSVYNVMSISALDHPNVEAELKGDPPPFPAAVRLLWIQEMLEKEAEKTDHLDGEAIEFPVGSGNYYLPNAVFQGRVLGEFPTQADQQVIPRAWLTNLPVLEPFGMPEIGCDVARFGTDRTTIGTRRGPCVMALREIRKLDTIEVANGCKDSAIEAAQQMGETCDPKKIPIRVDVTGGLGAGPYDTLKSWGYAAIPVNSSSTPVDTEQFKNVRSELWFVARERAKSKNLDISRLPAEIKKRLVKEWSTPKWKPNGAGQKIVDEKNKIKDKLGESPDLADGVNLSFYVGTQENKTDDYAAAYAEMYGVPLAMPLPQYR